MMQRREAERLRREITLYGGLLQKGRELEFNFRVNLIWVGWVNLIWVGWVNFNLGGFFYLDWVNFFWIGLFLNGYVMSYPSCH